MKTCQSLEIFNKITQIPRPSAKEEKMVEFLTNFAKENNLKYVVCGANNVIIYKTATNGSNSTIILQSHTDMVCEKDLNLNFNFDTQSIQTKIDGDIISACGTTLGADNGVGVSIILHILKSKDLKHCNIEAVFTSQEETTMEGARTLDYSLLKGSAILSLDGTDELCIDSASAGMVVTQFEKELNTTENNNKKYKLCISGLIGGHSGADIDKKRLNAIKLLNEILTESNVTSLYSIQGGNKDNAIPRDCVAIISTNNIHLLETKIAKIKNDVSNVYKEDREINITLTECNDIYNEINEGVSILNFINDLPNGVLEINANSFPITSCNVAKVHTDNTVKITLSLRSSSVEFEEKYLKQIETVASKHGFTFSILSKAPFFEENKKSKLIPLCKDIYFNLYGKEVIASPVHAGLEGGVFAEHMPNVDICVIGANLYNIHSTQERASISSIERVEKWVEKIVEQF